METSALISNPLFRFTPTPTTSPKPSTFPLNRRRPATRAAIDDASIAADPAQVQITWQIAAGTIAGVTPFVVAGVEFSKRIILQKRCKQCGGSGLVFVDDNYFRCPQCGGFLPWQSWKRFFSG